MTWPDNSLRFDSYAPVTDMSENKTKRKKRIKHDRGRRIKREKKREKIKETGGEIPDRNGSVIQLPKQNDRQT